MVQPISGLLPLTVVADVCIAWRHAIHVAGCSDLLFTLTKPNLSFGRHALYSYSDKNASIKLQLCQEM
jgi:hypothetical protein